jgi:hypothetical protein
MLVVAVFAAVASVVLSVGIAQIARALRATGPPFDNLKWWWPRRPRTNGDRGTH